MVHDPPHRSTRGPFLGTVLILALTILPIASIGDEPAALSPALVPAPDLAELVTAHNRERAEAKLPPLKANARLTAAAQAHADDMASHRMMNHVGSNGSTFDKRIELQGYRGRRLAENIAAGQTSVSSVMDSWMNSPPHKANLLGPFSEIGVGRARDDEGKPYWCVNFGVPQPELDPKAEGERVIEAINKAREAEGKPSLTANLKLNEAALATAKAFAGAGRLDAADQPSPETLIQQAGYRYRRLGEAAAMGQVSAADVAATWLEFAGALRQFSGPVPRDRCRSRHLREGRPILVGLPRRSLEVKLRVG